MRNAKQFRQAAWTTLGGRYWRALLAALIASVLGAFAVFISIGVNYGVSSEDFEHLREVFGESFSELPSVIENAYRALMQSGIFYALFALLGTVTALAFSCGLARFIIGAPVLLGHNLFSVSLYRSADKPNLEILFSRFPIFGRALWLRFRMAAQVFLWSLLLIVPGIVAAYRYAMAPYLLAEHPELTAGEAIEHSKALMQGNKWRLFCLNISFIGWYLLAGLTGGVGFVFLNPYVTAASAAFYLELTQQLPAPAYDAPSAPTQPDAPTTPPSEAPASDSPELI